MIGHRSGRFIPKDVKGEAEVPSRLRRGEAPRRHYGQSPPQRWVMMTFRGPFRAGDLSGRSIGIEEIARDIPPGRPPRKRRQSHEKQRQLLRSYRTNADTHPSRRQRPPVVAAQRVATHEDSSSARDITTEAERLQGYRKTCSCHAGLRAATGSRRTSRFEHIERSSAATARSDPRVIEMRGSEELQPAMERPHAGDAGGENHGKTPESYSPPPRGSGERGAEQNQVEVEVTPL